jgi:hypothetical protein
MNLQLIKHHNKFEENGDLMGGSEYFYDVYNDKYSEREYFYLEGISHNTWKSLNTILNEKVEPPTYKCPWTDNSFYSLIPLAIMSTDIHKYKDSVKIPSFKLDMIFDFEWTSYHFPVNEHNHDISKSLLGHGYTFCTLPYDGSPGTELTLMELSNGDHVICKSIIWYNK